MAEKDGSGRDWSHIRQAFFRCVIEEQRPGANGSVRTVHRVDEQLAADFARQCIYIKKADSDFSGNAFRSVIVAEVPFCDSMCACRKQGIAVSPNLAFR